MKLNSFLQTLLRSFFSQRGWVRAAKGFDVEADKMNYREGDAFLISQQWAKTIKM